MVVLALALVSARRRRPRALQTGWPVNLAHRGASATAPENTIEAFRLAAESGSGGLELDVHLSSDGRIIVIHDDTVDRTTDGTGLVREMTLEQIRSLDAGYNFSPDGGSTYPYSGREIRVPELREIFEEFPGVAVNIEIKENQPGAEKLVLQTIRDAGAQDRTLVASQKHPVIRRFRRICGGEMPTAASGLEIRIFYLLSLLRLESLLRPAYTALQVPESHRGIQIVTPNFVKAVHSRGVRLDVWTIDDPGDMNRLLDMGVDVIMTNRPGLLQEVLRKRGGSQ